MRQARLQLHNPLIRRGIDAWHWAYDVNEHAICIACGEERANPFDKYGAGDLIPDPGEQQLKRLYLSEFRYSNNDQVEQWRHELGLKAAQLQRSEPFAYDATELGKLKVVNAQLRAIPMSVVWGTLFRLFMPAVIFLAALWGFLFLLKALR